MKQFLLITFLFSFSAIAKNNSKEIPMKFGYTILYVKDVSATISFYEKAFRFSKKFVTEDNTYGEIESGATTLSFASFQMAKNNGLEINQTTSHASPVEIAFITENVDVDFDKAVKAGATLVKKPTAKPWGQKVGYLKDNNNFIIEICSPINK
jgi:lactoylglutathione lyase